MVNSTKYLGVITQKDAGWNKRTDNKPAEH